jgi:hypothetical protein
VSEVFDEPPGCAVGVEVLVVGEAGQLIEDVVGGVQQPAFEDLGVAEEFSQVFGLVVVEGDSFGGHVISVSGQAGMAGRRAVGLVDLVVRGRA